jgi:hypothetical protein
MHDVGTAGLEELLHFVHSLHRKQGKETLDPQNDNDSKFFLHRR